MPVFMCKNARVSMYSCAYIHACIYVVDTILVSIHAYKNKIHTYAHYLQNCIPRLSRRTHPHTVTMQITQSSQSACTWVQPHLHTHIHTYMHINAYTHTSPAKLHTTPQPQHTPSHSHYADNTTLLKCVYADITPSAYASNSQYAPKPALLCCWSNL
jgi:hypothetical protein